MNQAQAAIDAARAVEADKYATTEYSAATETLKNANTAVAARDYRLALNHALESHELAQTAARLAPEGKARTRVEVERAAADITRLVTQGRERLAAAERARGPRGPLAQPAQDLTAADAALQKSGEAIAAGDYLAARAALEGVKERVEAALAAIDDVVLADRKGPRRDPSRGP